MKQSQKERIGWAEDNTWIVKQVTQPVFKKQIRLNICRIWCVCVCLWGVGDLEQVQHLQNGIIEIIIAECEMGGWEEHLYSVLCSRRPPGSLRSVLGRPR